jgi:hypothetical protein
MRRASGCAVLVLVLTCSAVAGAVPVSCFVVHADPTRADDVSFEALSSLVALADRYSVPLTILLTAQWAEMILSSPEKTAAVQGFLARGHEIGVHHHAYWATLDRGAQWDGYANTPLQGPARRGTRALPWDHG